MSITAFALEALELFATLRHLRLGRNEYDAAGWKAGDEAAWRAVRTHSHLQSLEIRHWSPGLEDYKPSLELHAFCRRPAVRPLSLIGARVSGGTLPVSPALRGLDRLAQDLAVDLSSPFLMALCDDNVVDLEPSTLPAATRITILAGENNPLPSAASQTTFLAAFPALSLLEFVGESMTYDLFFGLSFAGFCSSPHGLFADLCLSNAELSLGQEGASTVVTRLELEVHSDNELSFEELLQKAQSAPSDRSDTWAWDWKACPK